jgi:hypothetical protein
VITLYLSASAAQAGCGKTLKVLSGLRVRIVGAGTRLWRNCCEHVHVLFNFPQRASPSFTTCQETEKNRSLPVTSAIGKAKVDKHIAEG